ncbi:MAG: hypothetical protein OEZ25_03550 [Candidatus Bathyarchaeota archaeon]|nr:hypothetical protein [Candidatus Bathyarchaeota archaeon]
MKDFIIPYLEWDVLHEPVTILKVDEIKELPEGQKRIEINRDERYKLRGTLYFKGDYDLILEKAHLSSTVPAGSFIKPFEIRGSDQHGFERYTVESCSFGGVHMHTGENGETLCEVNLTLDKLRIKYKTEAKGTRLTEWYLNGPRDNVFWKVTDRQVLKSFFRERWASKDEKIDSIKFSGKSWSGGSDFLEIKAGDLQFLVTGVPEGIGPNWSSNIGIEYKKSWGRIPDMNERKKIEELCSFIFGRQLLSIGYTTYDKDGKIVEGYAKNPRGDDPRVLCSKYDYPAIRISEPPARGKAEDLISQLLPSYFERRKPLHLEEALWFYWIARNMPPGPNLPMLAAAVETIMNGWFDHPKSKSRGVLMPKTKYKNVLREEIASIKSKLKEEKEGDKIIKNILQAYVMGVTDRFPVFFNEINLVVEEHEWHAIKKRHVFAHGGIEFDKTEWKPLIRQVQTYETLFHKIILKLLGYSGSYIDRSIVGWKDKQLV